MSDETWNRWEVEVIHPNQDSVRYRCQSKGQAKRLYIQLTADWNYAEAHIHDLEKGKTLATSIITPTQVGARKHDNRDFEDEIPDDK